jgi:hypothetical protein
MPKIQANNCLFQIDTDGEYKTVMCLRSFRISPSTIEKEITAPQDGKFKAYDYSQLSARVSIDGVLMRDAVNRNLFDFAQAQLNFLEVKARAIFYDDTGEPKVFTALCMVSECSLEASAGQLASATVELLVSGEYTIEDALPEFINLRIRLYNNDTITAFFRMQLIDTTGTAIFQSDILPEANGGNLSNPIDITVPVPKGNWFYWFNVATNGVGNEFNLDAPPTKTSSFNGNYTETSFPDTLYDFTADREASVGFGVNNPPPTCVAPAIASSNLPNGISGRPWAGSVIVTGTVPFTVSNVTRPSWMEISINDGTISLSGLPTTGQDQEITFDISNDCGTVNFSGAVDVFADLNSVVVNWEFTLGADVLGSVSFLIFKNGTTILTQTSSGSGSITASVLDVFQARIIGPPVTVTKEITVTGATAGEIETVGPSGFGVISTNTWTLHLTDSPYQITATATHS